MQNFNSFQRQNQDLNKFKTNYQLQSKKNNKFQAFFQEINDKIGVNNSAYLCYLFGVIFYLFGFLYMNENKVGALQSSLSRGTVLLIYNYVWLITSGKNMIVQNHWKILTFRNIIIVLHGVAFAESQFYLPLPIIHTIFCAGPFYVFVVDYIINKTHVSKKQIIGALISFLGVLLTINGQFILKQITNIEDDNWQTSFKHYKTENIYVKIFIGFLMSLATIPWAYAIVVIKRVKPATHYQINVNMGIIILMVAGIIYPMNFNTQNNNSNGILLQSIQNSQQNIHKLTRIQAFLYGLLFHGFPLAISQTLLILGLTLTKNSGVVTMIGMLAILISYITSVLRYGQKINIICLIGSILIVLGIFQILKK